MLTTKELRDFVKDFSNKFPEVKQVYLVINDDYGEDNCTVELEWPMDNILARLFIKGDLDAADRSGNMIISILEVEFGVKLIYAEIEEWWEEQ